MANLSREIDRGARAQVILNDELFKESMEIVEKAIVDRWRESPIGDKDGQHELRLMLKAFNDFRKNLEEVMNTGNLANLQRRQEIEKESKIKKFFRSGTLR